MTSINLLIEIFPKISDSVYCIDIIEVINRLRKDKIPNVRISIAKLCKCMMACEISESIRNELLAAMETLKNDNDIDVRIKINE